MKNLNKRVLESLILSGAFDTFGIDRGHLIASLDAIINHLSELEDDRQSGQTNMFDMLLCDASSAGKESSGNANIIDTSLPPMPLSQKLQEHFPLVVSISAKEGTGKEALTQAISSFLSLTSLTYSFRQFPAFFVNCHLHFLP